MSEVKKLAGQTIWYGTSAVAAKMLNALLTPLLTYFLVNPGEVIQYGSIGLIYSYFALLNVIFTYGMETAYFRFCSLERENTRNIYNTAFGSLIISTLLLCATMYFCRQPIADFIVLSDHVNYINLAIGILFFDTLQTIPFARLRQEQKPRKYAFIKVFGIVINILGVFFFLVIMPKLVAMSPGGFWAGISRKYDIVSLVLFANLLQSIFTFLALFAEWRQFRFKLEPGLWQRMFRYASPMIFIGLAGVANEVIDRQMLIWYIDNTEEYAKTVQSIYSASYKVSIVVTMFITAFRMAAEPFFFSRAQDKSAPDLYARVMKWFVITVCIAFLTTALFLEDIWINYLGKAYHSGLYIVPVLLFANVLSGIYYNLSTWYKVTNKMRIGVAITMFGALITLAGNYFFIPKYEMWAAAWTTLTCYASMVVLCYLVGQKYFPVPYPVKRIALYLLAIIVLYFVQHKVGAAFPGAGYLLLRLASGSVLFVLFGLLVLRLERTELKSMPVIGKFLK
ncbi:MAG: oligosaccharide flippase family protein [Taibaiella sp.]|nr:oligosaccharide flippase family protein [Taibaiella sp.]